MMLTICMILLKLDVCQTYILLPFVSVFISAYIELMRCIYIDRDTELWLACVVNPNGN